MLASILDYAIYFAVVPVLLFVVSVVVVLLRTRAKLRREGSPSSGEVEGVQLHPIKDATEADEIAYSIVDRCRKRIWRRMSINTSFGVSPIGDLCGSLISEIAHVYYAESPRPELEVTVTDLLDLNERVIARVRRLFEKFPLNRLQGLRMSQVLDYHRLYTSVSGNLIVRSIRNRWARRVARTAAIAARYADPRFWVMRGMTRGGREFAVRYLLTSIITIAGEEAILLYRRSSAEGQASENA
jgi:hypothetical protein